MRSTNEACLASTDYIVEWVGLVGLGCLWESMLVGEKRGGRGVVQSGRGSVSGGVRHLRLLRRTHLLKRATRRGRRAERLLRRRIVAVQRLLLVQSSFRSLSREAWGQPEGGIRPCHGGGNWRNGVEDGAEGRGW